MKKFTLKITGLLATAVLLASCGSKDTPPTVYFPDMYYPVAYDPLMKAEDAYSDHENEIPAFVRNNGATGMIPVAGTVSQNKEGLLPAETPQNVDEYNAMYDASKAVTASPLKPENKEKDLQRGKLMFEQACAACHGTAGDGQGPIVQSGAYVGVPAYKDRQISIGSVHYVIVNGRNAMGSYAGQLTEADRWRVAMYVMNAFKGGTSAPAAPAADATATSTTTTPAAGAGN